MSDTPDPPYERRDLNVRGLAIAVGVVSAGFAAALLLAWWVLRMGQGIPGAEHLLLQSPAVTPAPRLQVSPRQDLQAFMAEKQARLSSYGWVDRKLGVVHVPIEQAIQHVLDHGIPRWEPARDSEPGVAAHRARQRAVDRLEKDAP